MNLIYFVVNNNCRKYLIGVMKKYSGGSVPFGGKEHEFDIVSNFAH